MKVISFLTFVIILVKTNVAFGEKYLCETKVGSKLSFDGKTPNISLTIVGKKFLINTFENNTGLRYVKSINKEKNFYICGSKNQMRKNFEKEHNMIEFIDGMDSLSMEGVFSCRSTKKIEYGGHTRTEFIFETKKNIFSFYNNFLKVGILQIEKGSCLEI